MLRSVIRTSIIFSASTIIIATNNTACAKNCTCSCFKNSVLYILNLIDLRMPLDSWFFDAAAFSLTFLRTFFWQTKARVFKRPRLKLIRIWILAKTILFIHGIWIAFSIIFTWLRRSITFRRRLRLSIFLLLRKRHIIERVFRRFLA